MQKIKVLSSNVLRDDPTTDLPLEEMRLGTQHVKEMLGADFPVTEKEIQDSLWHYFFDVDKTVTYLMGPEYEHADQDKRADNQLRPEETETEKGQTEAGNPV